MADTGIVGQLAIFAAGLGTVGAAFAGSWLQQRKVNKAQDDEPLTNVRGALLDSRAARELSENIMRLDRTIVSSDQDRRSENRELYDWIRRLIEALQHNTDASRLDILPASITDALSKLDNTK